MLVEKRICVREFCECTAICRQSLCEICYCGRDIRVLHFHVRCKALLLCSGVLHFVLNLVFRHESGSKNVEGFLYWIEIDLFAIRQLFFSRVEDQSLGGFN